MDERPAETAIHDHGVIGDLHTAALVGNDGAIDWLCQPRFDSPSIFAALLDRENGGRWQISPAGSWTSEQRYHPGTNVLQTEFRAAEGGVVQLVDFMPVGRGRDGRSRVVRCVKSIRGDVPVLVHWEPRFDYGRRQALLTVRANGVLATDRWGDVAAVSGPGRLRWEVESGAARATLEAREGECAWFVQTFDEDEVHDVEDHDPNARLIAATRYWDQWSSGLHYTGPWRREVERSALALKLCCYEPSGAIVAAPTTSLPESLTGGRNWDYRFAWLRDSAIVLYALQALGFESETDEFLRFLKRVTRREEAGHLQVMYAVDGARELSEQVVSTLRGYRGCGPVRIGNGAAGQYQLDTYGEVVETIAMWLKHKGELTEGLWKVVRDLVGYTVAHWREPDFSIWEPRHDPKHHVFSKVLAWVAMDRGARIAADSGHGTESVAWSREAELVKAEVMEKGWDPVRQTLVQCYGEPQLDAALFLVPYLGFLPRLDPRVKTTIAAIRAELGSKSEELVYRYRSQDGLEGDEGAFVICSFWMIQALAMSGELDEAERLFKNLLRRSSETGLLAEEIDPGTGEQLGNFPQGLSHASLISTAHILEELRRERAGQPIMEPKGGPPIPPQHAPEPEAAAAQAAPS